MKLKKQNSRINILCSLVVLVLVAGCATGGDPVRSAIEKTAIGISEAKDAFAWISEVDLKEISDATIEECMQKKLTQEECKSLYSDRRRGYYELAEALDMAHMLILGIEKGYDAVQSGRAGDIPKLLKEVKECLWHIEFIMRKFQALDSEVPNAVQDARKYLELLKGALSK